MGLLKNIYLIITGTSSSKFQLLLAYLKIQIKYSLLVQVFRVPLHTEKFLGFTVSFFDYRVFIFLFREIFIKGEYHFTAQNSTPVILDCGSNIGMSVLFFKGLFPEARITGFEPDPKTFTLLESNIRRNNLLNVRTLNAAVCGSEGEIDFYEDSEITGNPMMSTLKDRTPNAVVVRTKAIMLSSFITQEIDFAKIDVEGAETEIIQELARSGKLRQIRQMCIEYHHHMKPHDDSLSRILSVLEENGFGYQIDAQALNPYSAEFQDLLLTALRIPK